ncbi:formate dehydrogenase accessory sulfurtransferase FdhD [Wukongibacter baidiensis]|uniref:formate dehydrogenase accessory sulfurtransferase FdhD n=1 Tax=Wukongibacter baidiensis TaxID=1723361 RepID=UPI003D7FA98F
MQVYKEVTITKIEDDKIYEKEDMVIKEYPLTIFINDEEFITLLCTPQSLDYLTIGFLISEGLIKRKEDIKSMRIDEIKGTARVEIKGKDLLTKKLYGKRTMTTGCGKGTIFYSVIDALKTKKIYNDFDVKKEYIFQISNGLNKRSELFIKTGGVHSCLLCSKEDELIFHEDVGRHNAIDKIIGEAFVKDIDLKDKIILTSGRISSEMLLKSAKVGVPVVVSRSAATDLAVDIANKLGITLVGFARGKKMNIYSHEERIL